MVSGLLSGQSLTRAPQELARKSLQGQGLSAGLVMEVEVEARDGREEEGSAEVEVLQVGKQSAFYEADTSADGFRHGCAAMPSPLVVVPSLAPLTRKRLHTICDELGLWHRTLHGA